MKQELDDNKIELVIVAVGNTVHSGLECLVDSPSTQILYTSWESLGEITRLVTEKVCNLIIDDETGPVRPQVI